MHSRLSSILKNPAEVAHLVEFEANSAGAEFLGFIDGGLQRPSLGTEPEPVVHQLRIPGHQLILPPHTCTLKTTQAAYRGINSSCHHTYALLRPIRQVQKCPCSLPEPPDVGRPLRAALCIRLRLLARCILTDILAPAFCFNVFGCIGAGASVRCPASTVTFQCSFLAGANRHSTASPHLQVQLPAVEGD